MFRVMLVEDDVRLAALAKEYLEAYEFAVDIVDRGDAALVHFRATQPDLVVLDLLMPEMNGFEVVDEMHGCSETASIPIVILTNKSLSREEKDRLNGRIIAIRQKGEFHREDFVAQVRSLLKPEEPAWQAS